MQWVKKGVILHTTDLGMDWALSHVQMPVPYHVNNDILRIYLSVRNKECKAKPICVDLNAKDYSVLEMHTDPLLELGKPGTFDDCGIMFSSCIELKKKLYMYYVGWNRDHTLPYTLSIGLAVSEDGGLTFRKVSEGPIMDRDLDCPYFNTAPFVLKENDYIRMWYVYCTEWQYNKTDGYVPAYLIKSAISEDGIHWNREAGNCIEYKNVHEAIGRPWVNKSGGRYYMWYSYRDTRDFRKNKENAYMIGLAELKDGRNWIRRDNCVGITKSDNGWDSEMMCYASIIENNGEYVMFYNGNEHGKYAFGYATCKKEDFMV